MNYPNHYYPMPPPHGQSYQAQQTTITPSQQLNTNPTTQLDYGRKAAEAALPAPVHDPSISHMEPPNPYYHLPAPHNAPQWPPPPMPIPHHHPPHMPIGPPLPPPPYYHTHPAYPPVPQPPAQAVISSHAVHNSPHTTRQQEDERLLISSNPLHAAARVQPPKPTDITTTTLDDGSKQRIGTFISDDGTEVTKVLCDYDEECTKPAKEELNGKCYQHYITKLTCSYEGCYRTAYVQGGLCSQHEMMFRPFGQLFNDLDRRRDGGYNSACRQAVAYNGNKFEYTIRHGRKIALCSYEGCCNKVVQGGVCKRHGAKVKICSREGCDKHAKKGGLCFRHSNVDEREREIARGRANGGDPNQNGDCASILMQLRRGIKICTHEGCDNIAAEDSTLCVTHGVLPATREVCSFGDCTKLARKNGVCEKHGRAAFGVSIEEGVSLSKLQARCREQAPIVARFTSPHKKKRKKRLPPVCYANGVTLPSPVNNDDDDSEESSENEEDTVDSSRNEEVNEEELSPKMKLPDVCHQDTTVKAAQALVDDEKYKPWNSRPVKRPKTQVKRPKNQPTININENVHQSPKVSFSTSREDAMPPESVNGGPYS